MASFILTLTLHDMARLLAIDYGTKRTGIAITDELQIIASGLTTVDTKDLLPFFKDYTSNVKAELFLPLIHICCFRREEVILSRWLWE